VRRRSVAWPRAWPAARVAVRAIPAYLVTMELEIWSDVMCPFCYMGKRRLEGALRDFPHKDEVKILWRSYQLDPEMQPAPGKSIH
jgi:predicted DsbA family dithiol-disulfide isomerase